MNRALLVGLCVTLLLGSVGVAGVPTASAQEELDPDDVLLSVSVDDDGDAAWTVEYRTRLDTNDSETAFEEYREDLESDPEPYRERFHNRMNATAADAENATGREMAIRNVTVRATRENLPQEYGVVTYSFEWTNFAAVEGDRLVVGDAVEGLFLDEETSLYVSWPAGYSLEGADPTPSDTRERAVLWSGPMDFAADEPRVVLASGADASGDGAARTETPVAPAALPFALGFLVVLVVGALGYGVYDGAGPFGSGGDAGAGGGNDAGAGGGNGAGGGDGDSRGTGGAVSGTDDELLSNEEQVLRLVDERGGRMKQAAIADELGWTAAKTSQVTTSLREAGELEAFRLGRENVLERPDEDD